MKGAAIAMVILAVGWMVPILRAEDGGFLDIEGRIETEGGDWSGQAAFRFALVDEADRVVWHSHKVNVLTGGRGITNLRVEQGLYRVRLGDPEAGMAPLLALPSTTKPLHLRVWTDAGGQAGELREMRPDALLPSREDQDSSGMETVLLELRQLRAEVAQLRQSLNGVPQPAGPPPAPREVVIPWRDRPVLGDAAAPLVVVEFLDYQCPFCERFELEILPQIREEWIGPKRLKLVSVQLPLASHPQARRAAEMLLCVHEQLPSAYWEIRKKLHREAGASVAEIIQETTAGPLNAAALQHCLTSPEAHARVEEDLNDAAAAGIQATPTFVLGVMEGNQVRGEVIVGAPSFQFFAQKFQEWEARVERMQPSKALGPSPGKAP